MGSKAGSLSKMDWKKIGVGACVAVAGALATYLEGLAFDFGSYTPIAVAVNSILINALRKFAMDTR